MRPKGPLNAPIFLDRHVLSGSRVIHPGYFPDFPFSSFFFLQGLCSIKPTGGIRFFKISLFPFNQKGKIGGYFQKNVKRSLRAKEQRHNPSEG